jgi:hypothetical protein
MGHAQRELSGQAPYQASTPTGPVPATTNGQVPSKAQRPITRRVTFVVTDTQLSRITELRKGYSQSHVY